MGHQQSEAFSQKVIDFHAVEQLGGQLMYLPEDKRRAKFGQPHEAVGYGRTFTADASIGVPAP